MFLLRVIYGGAWMRFSVGTTTISISWVPFYFERRPRAERPCILKALEGGKLSDVRVSAHYGCMDTSVDTCFRLPELDFGQMPPSVCWVKCECCCAEARLCGPVTFRFWRAVFFGNWCRASVEPRA